MDPIHQFEVTEYFSLGTIGGVEFAFTKSALFMLISVALVALLMIGATGSRAIVPGRLQSLAELCYEFVADTLQATTGAEGMRFFPFVFTLFMFGQDGTVGLCGCDHPCQRDRRRIQHADRL